MASEQIRVPFTAEQVVALNRYQHAGFFHPFTCGHCRDTLGTGAWPDDVYQGPLNERLLVATEAGWTCPTCDYTQDWAWAAMAEPLPPNPFGENMTDPERDA